MAVEDPLFPVVVFALPLTGVSYCIPHVQLYVSKQREAERRHESHINFIKGKAGNENAKASLVDRFPPAPRLQQPFTIRPLRYRCCLLSLDGTVAGVRSLIHKCPERGGAECLAAGATTRGASSISNHMLHVICRSIMPLHYTVLACPLRLGGDADIGGSTEAKRYSRRHICASTVRKCSISEGC